MADLQCIPAHRLPGTRGSDHLLIVVSHPILARWPRHSLGALEKLAAFRHLNTSRLADVHTIEGIVNIARENVKQSTCHPPLPQGHFGQGI